MSGRPADPALPPPLRLAVLLPAGDDWPPLLLSLPDDGMDAPAVLVVREPEAPLLPLLEAVLC